MMKLTLKTIDHQVMTLDVERTCLVSDLITMVEDMMGKENLYKMIYAGKLLQDDKPLTEYNIKGGKLPIVVLVTKPPVLGDLRVPRVRTESEDSGYGEEAGEHFVTDKEFKIALEVVMSCEHLNRGDQRVLKRGEMEDCAKLCAGEEVRRLIMDRLEMVEQAGLTKQRFEAFVYDIQSIYDEAREGPRNCDSVEANTSEMLDDIDESSSDSDDDSMDEEDDKVKRLTNMGFSEEDSIRALEMNANNLTLALEHLLPSEATPAPKPLLHNPLDFLRDSEEFQYLRYLVLQDPNLLQPLLISFGQSHPYLMAQINENKDIFVRMIHEQTGAKRHGRH